MIQAAVFDAKMILLIILFKYAVSARMYSDVQLLIGAIIFDEVIHSLIRTFI